MKNSLLLSKLKEKVDNLLHEISKETNMFSKVKKYEEILKWNNTNKTYVKDYLSLLQKCAKKSKIYIDKMKIQLHLFKKIIPKDEFNKEFSEFEVKEMSSFEEIKRFFEKIKNFNFNVKTLKEKSREYKFIQEKIIEYAGEIKCNSPITYDNKEFYVYFLFHSYLKNLERKIENYKNAKFEGEKSKDLEEAENLIKEIESSYKNFKDDLHILEANQL